MIRSSVIKVVLDFYKRKRQYYEYFSWVPFMIHHFIRHLRYIQNCQSVLYLQRILQKNKGLLSIFHDLLIDYGNLKCCLTSHICRLVSAERSSTDFQTDEYANRKVYLGGYVTFITEHISKSILLAHSELPSMYPIITI